MIKQRPVKWLIERAGKERFKLLILILSNAFFSALSVFFAFAVKLIIDGATTGQKEKIYSGSFLICSIVLLQFIFRLIINGLAENIKGKLEISYKTRIFSVALKKKYKDITSYHSGELMNRLTSDVSIISDSVTSIIPTAVSAFVRLISAVVALVILDYTFAIVFIIAGLSVFIITSLLRGKLKSLHKEIQSSEGKTRSFMQECLENILTLKVFSAHKEIENKSNQLQETNFKIKMHRRNYSIFGHSAYNMIFSAGYVFALIYGAVKIFNDATGLTATGFTYGTLSAVLQLVNNVQVPFASLSLLLPKYYSAVASAERLLEIEKLQNECETDLEKTQRAKDFRSINIENLTFAYEKDLILENASFVIHKGEFVSICGASGIGKSTLFKLLLGVYKGSGEIYFDTPSGNIELDESTREIFSYVPQGNMLFSGTIKDNITFLKEGYSNDDIDRALKISLSKEFVDALPNGINTVIGENGSGLSEGQIQRLAVARAVIKNCPIMLLDEATSALDLKTEEKLISNLKSLKDTTVIMISHKRTAIENSDVELLVSDKKFINNTNKNKK